MTDLKGLVERLRREPKGRDPFIGALCEDAARAILALLEERDRDKEPPSALPDL